MWVQYNIALHLLYVYGVATVSKSDQNIGLFRRISSLLKGSFANEAYHFKEPTIRSHPMLFNVHLLYVVYGAVFYMLCMVHVSYMHTQHIRDIRNLPGSLWGSLVVYGVSSIAHMRHVFYCTYEACLLLHIWGMSSIAHMRRVLYCTYETCTLHNKATTSEVACLTCTIYDIMTHMYSVRDHVSHLQCMRSSR